jgi:DEAD/DEAH box helicase domain-containing protein
VVGLGNVLRTVGALLLMADPRDLGVATGSRHEVQTGAAEPDLFLYDTFPGGIGQSEPLFKMRRDLLAKARELLMACPCEEGCPSCVGPPGEVGVGAKEVASRLAAELLVAEKRSRRESEGGFGFAHVVETNFSSQRPPVNRPERSEDT